MKLNLKKNCYLIAVIIFSVILIFMEHARSNNNSYQASGIETTSSSGQFSIPTCSSCNSVSVSEPTCSGTTSPKCTENDTDVPSCQLIGDLCSPVCLPTDPPNSNFPNNPFCSTKYLLVDGDGAGIQLYSGIESPSKISSTTNSTTLADGFIKEPDENCAGPNPHFNGFISNFSVSPGGCGWGHVVIFKKLPERLNLISDIITSTKRASYKTQAIAATDFGAALLFIKNYSDNLKKLKDLIAKSKDIKSVKKKVILRKIELILKPTEVAKSNLSSLANAQNPSHTAEVDPYQRDAARTALSKTQDAEVEIFKLLLKFDKIQ